MLSGKKDLKQKNFRELNWLKFFNSNTSSRKRSIHQSSTSTTEKDDGASVKKTKVEA